MVGMRYLYKIIATGGPAPAISVTGTLPAGVSFDGVDTISGTAPASGDGHSRETAFERLLCLDGGGHL